MTENLCERLIHLRCLIVAPQPLAEPRLDHAKDRFHVLRFDSGPEIPKLILLLANSCLMTRMVI